MDRRVKERLVGATILVVLIVLIVPEFLSGPKLRAPAPLSLPAPTRNVSVDLATSRATPTVRLADGSQTGAEVKAAEAPGAPPPATPGLETRSSSTKSAVSNEAQPPSARDSWQVQLGSFSSKANAEKLVHQLKARGLSAYVNSNGLGSSSRFRVRMGPMPDRVAAEREVDKLKALGHVATIVSPAS